MQARRARVNGERERRLHIFAKLPFKLQGPRTAGQPSGTQCRDDLGDLFFADTGPVIRNERFADHIPHSSEISLKARRASAILGEILKSAVSNSTRMSRRTDRLRIYCALRSSFAGRITSR